MLIRCERCKALYSLQDGVLQGQSTFRVECGRCLLTFQAQVPQPHKSKTGEPATGAFATGPRAAPGDIPTNPARPKPLLTPRSVTKVAQPSGSLEHHQKAGDDLARSLKPRRPQPGGEGADALAAPSPRNKILIGVCIALALAVAAFLGLHHAGGVSKDAQAKLVRAHEKLLLDDEQSLSQASALYTEVAHLAPGEAAPEADRAFSLLLQAGSQKDLADRLEARAKDATDHIARLQLDKAPGWEKQASDLSDQIAQIALVRDPHVREATRLLQQGLAAAKQALEEEPEDASALRAMALYCALADAPDRAAHFLDLAEQKAPDDPLTAYARATAALAGSPSRAKQDKALTALAQVRQLEPLFLRATYDQAAISFARQEFAPAREALAKLLQTNPQHERAKQLLALLPAPQ